MNCPTCGVEHREATPKQQRFAEEYLLDLNASAAAIRAGYSKRTAGQLGWQLLQKTSIACVIQQGSDARSERTELDADWILKRLARIADFDPIDYMRDDGSLKPLSDIPDEARRVLAGLETETDIVSGGDEADDVTTRTRKIKLPDRLKAYELLGRHLKMWVDRMELAGAIDLRAEILKGRERADKGATG